MFSVVASEVVTNKLHKLHHSIQLLKHYITGLHCTEYYLYLYGAYPLGALSSHTPGCLWWSCPVPENANRTILYIACCSCSTLCPSHPTVLRKINRISLYSIGCNVSFVIFGCTHKHAHLYPNMCGLSVSSFNVSILLALGELLF